MRYVDDFGRAQVHVAALRDLDDLRLRANQYRSDQFACGCLQRSRERRCFAVMHYCRWNGRKAATTFEQGFVLSSAGACHVFRSAAMGVGERCAAGPVSFRASAKMMASATPYKSGSNAA